MWYNPLAPPPLITTPTFCADADIAIHTDKPVIMLFMRVIYKIFLTLFVKSIG